MTKNKISPLEQLRIDAATVKAECRGRELRVKDNFNYLKGNFGSLLLSSVVSSSKNSIVSLFSGITGNPVITGNKKSSLMDKVSILSPVIFEIAQPILLGLATKKIKSLFKRKKKK